MSSPRGKDLHFFPEGTSPGKRRRRLLSVGILLLAAVALIWPVYPLFSAARPLVLGLPLSMAWIVFWLICVFSTMLVLYLTE